MNEMKKIPFHVQVLISAVCDIVYSWKYHEETYFCSVVSMETVTVNRFH